MTDALKMARPLAWLCELMQEDGSVRTMIVQEDPDGLRFNDIGEPSPFKVTPLYAQSTRSSDVSKNSTAIDAQQAAPTVKRYCCYGAAAEVGCDDDCPTKRAPPAVQAPLTDAEVLRVFNGPGLSPADRFKLHAALFTRIWRLCESVHRIGAAAQGGEHAR